MLDTIKNTSSSRPFAQSRAGQLPDLLANRFIVDPCQSVADYASQVSGKAVVHLEPILAKLLFSMASTVEGGRLDSESFENA